MSFEPLVKALFAATATTDRALHSLKETTTKMTHPTQTTDPPPLPTALKYTEIAANVHYRIDELNGSYHWESIGPCEVLGLCSEDGHPDPAAAADEAKETIALATTYGVEQALALLDDFQSMLNRLYPSDIEAISAAVQVIPLDDRWLSAYEMAKRTQPMPRR